MEIKTKKVSQACLSEGNLNDRECPCLPESCKTAYFSGRGELVFYVGDACPIGDKVVRKTTIIPSELELKQPEKPQLI